MVDPWTNYVSLVSGLSKATRAKAVAAARSVLAQAGLDDVAADAGERISKLAEEITAASRANREVLEKLVTAEVDKAATRLGFVRAEDLSEIRAELAALKAQLIVLTAPASDPAARAPIKKTPAKRPAATRAATDSDAPAQAPARKTTPSRAPAQKTTVRKTAAKKTAAKKTSAQKVAAQKVAAKQATSSAETDA